MSQDHTPVPQASPRRPWRRIALVTLIGGLAAGVGAKVFAQGGPGFGHHCGMHRMHADGDFFDQSPDAMQQRVEGFVKWSLADVKATDAQQKQIASILAAAAADMKPLRDQHKANRDAIGKALTAPTVDRTALEALRAKELELAEAASKRFTLAVADAADVLSPDQRAKLLERMEHARHRRT
jgi:periplasmic protein CpxP/Spy